jgi:hypothetical protein
MVEIEPISVTRGKAARNERRKAVATTCNAMSVALVVSLILQPMNNGQIQIVSTLLALGGSVVSQGLLHYLLGRVED